MKNLKYKRDLVRGEKVKVYRNLTDGKISVMDSKGRVVSHVEHIWLCDAKFIVRESGRQKVLLEKRKNVHAFVSGSIIPPSYDRFLNLNVESAVRVTYNPYKQDKFFEAETGEPILSAKGVSVDKNGKIWAIKN